MASAEVLIISSPVWPLDSLGSSPCLPSPSELLSQGSRCPQGRKPLPKLHVNGRPSRVEGAATPTPKTTVSRIDAALGRERQVSCDGAKPTNPTTRTKIPRSVATVSAGPGSKGSGVDPELRKAKAVQTRIETATVKKPISRKANKRLPAEKASTEPTGGGVCSEQEQVAVRDSEDLGLEQATRRRISWTPPPKDTFTILTSSDPPEPMSIEADTHSERIEPRPARNGFGNLRQDFGFTPVTDDAGCIRGIGGPDAQPATKKRRLEVKLPPAPGRSPTGANSTLGSSSWGRWYQNVSTQPLQERPNQQAKPAKANQGPLPSRLRLNMQLARMARPRLR